MADDASTGGSAAPGPEANHAVQRIGTAERQSAVEALSEHTRAGRLTAHEYEDRSEAAKHAMTRDELQQIFVDLPAPHPAADPAPALAPATGSRPGAVNPGHPVAGPGGPGEVLSRPGAGGLVPESVGIWLVSLMPFIALALFFITSQWLWFLLIPVAGIVVYGPQGKGDRNRRRNR